MFALAPRIGLMNIIDSIENIPFTLRNIMDYVSWQECIRHSYIYITVVGLFGDEKKKGFHVCITCGICISRLRNDATMLHFDTTVMGATAWAVFFSMEDTVFMSRFGIGTIVNGVCAVFVFIL